MREGLRSRVFWILTATLFLGALGLNGTITHLSALLTDRGFAAGTAAYAVSALGGANLLGRLVTGYLLDRFAGPRIAMGLLGICGLGMFLLAQPVSPLLAALGTILIGFGLGGESDVIPYLLGRYLGLRSFSTLYGFTWTAYAVATAMSSVLMGKVFDATGSYQLFLLPFAAVMFVSAGLMMLMPPYPASKETISPIAVAVS